MNNSLVVIPTYNEIENIQALVEKVLAQRAGRRGLASAARGNSIAAKIAVASVTSRPR